MWIFFSFFILSLIIQLGDIKKWEKTRPRARLVDEKQQQKTILSESPKMTEGWLLQTTLHNWPMSWKKCINIYCEEKTLWSWPIWHNCSQETTWGNKTISKGSSGPRCINTGLSSNGIKSFALMNQSSKSFSWMGRSMCMS